MRHPRERRRRYDQVGAEHLLDLPTEGVAHAGDGVGQQLLLHAHHVVDRVDPGHLQVQPGELGRMA
jgi:hypothetical protein